MSDVTREQALSAWGKVWAGSVPAGLADAFKNEDYATAKALADAQIADQARAEALAEDAKRSAPRATFTLASRRTELEFTIETTDKVTTYRGTDFVPNWCEATVHGGQLVSVILSRLDENKWGIDDPAGPDGAELYVSFGGGEIEGDAINALPKVAQEALAAIKWALR